MPSPCLHSFFIKMQRRQLPLSSLEVSISPYLECCWLAKLPFLSIVFLCAYSPLAWPC